MPDQPQSVETYVSGILSGDRNALSRAITLIESTREDHNQLARKIVSRCLPHTGHGIRIGITGPPGAGKSTFIDALGMLLCTFDTRVAVLAIDPSSTLTRGSILADKTRMTRLASSPLSFIRPSPNSGIKGGSGSNTREALILCEAAGYEVIFVETVGVGQSELDVYTMVDMLIVLLITGAGDDIQGIKRGIMEMADLILVNKADNENKHPAQILRQSLQRIVPIMPQTRPKWSTPVSTVSSTEATGIEKTWEIIQDYHNTMRSNGHFAQNRRAQSITWMHTHIENELSRRFQKSPTIKDILALKESEVASGNANPVEVAEDLLTLFFSSIEESVSKR